ncbi:MAG: redox-regulated ATPase YchF [Candidatus Saccharimonadales bacterium]
MSLSIGIVGLPNVGKSTLFNALTSNNALAANYPFATIEPNVGVVGVPDERLDKLAGVYPGAPIVPADVHFTDIAGLVSGASTGEGLGNQFLANIRETGAIAHVVRTFADSNVTHVAEDIDPERDISTINTELVLADLASVEKRLRSIAKAARAQPALKRDITILEELYQALDNGKLITNFVQNGDVGLYLEKAKVSHDTQILVTQLLTAKPMLYVFNIDEQTLTNAAKMAKLSALVSPSLAVFICAQIEAELQGLSAEDAREMLQEYGQHESGLSKLIHAGFGALGLQSFFTAGEKEVRAWTIPQAATAPQAAGAIHTDFERGFIAAEIINWEDLVTAGSRAAARTSGKLRTEGKDYQMQDGDVAEFRFNI